MVLKEPELFSYLKEFYYPDLFKSQAKYAHYDCTTNKHKLYIELKSRNTHYDDLLIEQIKYNAIFEVAVSIGYKPFYINSTPKGIWSFDLDALPFPKWEDKWLPQNTEFSARGNKTKVVGYLSIKDGKEL